MRLTTGILAVAITAGAAWAQNPDLIDSAKSTMKAVEQKKEMDINAALGNTPAKPAVQPAASHAAAQPTMKPAVHTATKPAAPKSAAPAAASKAPAPKSTAPAPAKAAAPKATPKVKAVSVTAKPAPKAAKAKPAATPVAANENDNPDNAKKADAPAETHGPRRDPFISPVVTRLNGSGCSTGKKCLDIESIALRGVVRADSGMIAVVTNELNKAYFLRENDPVFNGFVVKITGDSVIFKQTVQDRLGKSSQREVVKKITTPAV